jgi:hypothetical protein
VFTGQPTAVASSACFYGGEWTHCARLSALAGDNGRTLLISATLVSFLSRVLSALVRLVSYMRVPAASSSMDRISGGFMFSTFMMRPCEERPSGDPQLLSGTQALTASRASRVWR